jgi:predicted metal-dependent phosphoesterase TrpH
MFDLHLHTTASDGDFAPADVVRKAWKAGLRTIAITDHDTVAGVSEAQQSGDALRMRVIAGIEVSAAQSGRDVHVLGYFVNPAQPALLTFLQDQRADRVDRVREMARRLSTMGKPIDDEALLAPYVGRTDRTVGRPAVARALVAAGHVPTVAAAFATLIGTGGPAFVPRRSASVGTVVSLVHAAGGVASLAHPGLLRRDDLIPRIAETGLDALEVYHSDHTPEDVERYRRLAATLRLAVSGGSDFHGERRHGLTRLGRITLPSDEFERLAALVASPSPE